MVFVVLALLGILLYIGVMYVKHIELKYKKTRITTDSKYKCPACGSDIGILNSTDYNIYFNCSNPYCVNYGWGVADISYMNKHAQAKVIQERVPNPDNIKDWDLASAKDVEFTKVSESFNRKSELD